MSIIIIGARPEAEMNRVGGALVARNVTGPITHTMGALGACPSGPYETMAARDPAEPSALLTGDSQLGYASTGRAKSTFKRRVLSLLRNRGPLRRAGHLMVAQAPAQPRTNCITPHVPL